MALPSSGPISLKQVRDELKITGSISLNDTKVRELAGISSGQISLRDFYGKSTQLPYIYQGDLTIGNNNSPMNFYSGYSFKDNMGKITPTDEKFLSYYLKGEDFIYSYINHKDMGNNTACVLIEENNVKHYYSVGNKDNSGTYRVFRSDRNGFLKNRTNDTVKIILHKFINEKDCFILNISKYDLYSEEILIEIDNIILDEAIVDENYYYIPKNSSVHIKIPRGNIFVDEINNGNETTFKMNKNIDIKILTN